MRFPSLRQDARPGPSPTRTRRRNALPPRSRPRTGDRRVKPSEGRTKRVLRPTCGASVRKAPIHRLALISYALSRSGGTPICRHENRASPSSRKGSVKYSSGAPSVSAASSSSCAVTRRVPVSMVETVCLSLNPSSRATSSCDRPRACRSALIRLPMRSLAMLSPGHIFLADKCLQEFYASVLLVARHEIRDGDCAHEALPDACAVTVPGVVE